MFTIPLNTINKRLYSEKEIILVSRKFSSDPLDETGFMELEGALAQALNDATTVAISEMSKYISSFISGFDKTIDSEEYRGRLITEIALIFYSFSVNITNIVFPVINKDMLSIAQSSFDSWASSLGGKLLDLSDFDSDIIDKLSRKITMFVYRFFNQGMMNSAIKKLDNLYSEYDRNHIKIADYFSEYMGDLVLAGSEYWPYPSIASLNTARSFATIEYFYTYGVKTFAYWNPLDERTTTFCKEVAGKEMSVSYAREHIYKAANTNSFEGYTNQMPFVNRKSGGSYYIKRNGDNVEFESSQINEEFMMSMNLVVPPFHNSCRTLIIIP